MASVFSIVDGETREVAPCPVARALRERRVLEFAVLFEPKRGVAVLVVTFLALLELARELLIEITQSESFAPIYVKLGYAQPV